MKKIILWFFLSVVPFVLLAQKRILIDSVLVYGMQEYCIADIFDEDFGSGPSIVICMTLHGHNTLNEFKCKYVDHENNIHSIPSFGWYESPTTDKHHRNIQIIAHLALPADTVIAKDSIILDHTNALSQNLNTLLIAVRMNDAPNTIPINMNEMEVVEKNNHVAYYPPNKNQKE